MVSAAESDFLPLRKPWELLQQFQQELPARLYGLVYATKFICKIKNRTDLLLLCFSFSYSFFSAKHEPQPPFPSDGRVGAGFQHLFRSKADQHSKVKAIKITVETGKNIGWWILISCVSALITVLILTGMTSQHTGCSCFLSFLFYCHWLVSALLCPVLNHPLGRALSEILLFFYLVK